MHFAIVGLPQVPNHFSRRSACTVLHCNQRPHPAALQCSCRVLGMLSLPHMLECAGEHCIMVEVKEGCEVTLLELEQQSLSVCHAPCAHAGLQPTTSRGNRRCSGGPGARRSGAAAERALRGAGRGGCRRQNRARAERGATAWRGGHRRPGACALAACARAPARAGPAQDRAGAPQHATLRLTPKTKTLPRQPYHAACMQ